MNEANVQKSIHDFALSRTRWYVKSVSSPPPMACHWTPLNRLSLSDASLLKAEGEKLRSYCPHPTAFVDNLDGDMFALVYKRG
jgi:hypothetical protein